MRHLIPTGLWILYVQLAWVSPIFNDQAINKENDVAPLISHQAYSSCIMTFGKNEFLRLKSMFSPINHDMTPHYLATFRDLKNILTSLQTPW